MSDQLIVKVKDLSKSFKTGEENLEILKDVNLEMEKEKISALYGPSGSGKSTLLHLLGGLDRPDTGTIEVDGEDISTLNDEKLSLMRKVKIGYVFQFHHLLVDFTALENVMMPILMNGLNKIEARKNAEQLLDRVGLSNRLEHKPSELSGGEKQRVAIARALANNPLLVLADEPTGNLDMENSKHLLDLIATLNEEMEKTFLIVTHDQEISNIADTKYQIMDKKILRMG